MRPELHLSHRVVCRVASAHQRFGDGSCNPQCLPKANRDSTPVTSRCCGPFVVRVFYSDMRIQVSPHLFGQTSRDNTASLHHQPTQGTLDTVRLPLVYDFCAANSLRRVVNPSRWCHRGRMKHMSTQSSSSSVVPAVSTSVQLQTRSRAGPSSASQREGLMWRCFHRVRAQSSSAPSAVLLLLLLAELFRRAQRCAEPPAHNFECARTTA